MTHYGTLAAVDPPAEPGTSPPLGGGLPDP